MYWLNCKQRVLAAQHQLTSGAIRDVGLAIVAHNAAISISNHQGIEVCVASTLKKADCTPAAGQTIMHAGLCQQEVCNTHCTCQEGRLQGQATNSLPAQCFHRRIPNLLQPANTGATHLARPRGALLPASQSAG